MQATTRGDKPFLVGSMMPQSPLLYSSGIESQHVSYPELEVTRQMRCLLPIITVVFAASIYKHYKFLSKPILQTEPTVSIPRRACRHERRRKISHLEQGSEIDFLLEAFH